MKTKVGIIGAGPAGLMLGQLLSMMKIENVVLEKQSQSYTEKRVRAGQIGEATVRLLTDAGVGSRVFAEGIIHTRAKFQYDDEARYLDFHALTGQTVTIYSQQEILKDLINARHKAGEISFYEVSDIEIHGINSNSPQITFCHNNQRRILECDFVVGCDGFHGVSRAHISNALTHFEHEYPFAWLALLAQMPPVSADVIFANHESGLALCTMRSPSISRIYLQSGVDEDPREWSNEKTWDLLRRRLQGGAASFENGIFIEKTIVRLRAYVSEPMQHGRLFLAGDAAHIVPPSAAKGLNLALADARTLARGFDSYYSRKQEDLLTAYSTCALEQIWRDMHFSDWMVRVLHRSECNPRFNHRLQISDLHSAMTSEHAARHFARSYVGPAPSSLWI
ncbi:4-hydroxybenzoate 3-monooxygenase [Methylobacterium indicum]|uniref:4-hydroxybenzoate 3-monooxygenase n=1 Tax=Methylobacterium indicum TaxID=1775910 RepID=UPI001A913D21|nr:4-hydroxybenzoate 3-monooxygenase [Methylobacterium indicum]